MAADCNFVLWISGDLLPRHVQIFSTNSFFKGMVIPEPEKLVSNKGAVSACMQIRRCVMKFCHLTKFQHAPAYLMILKFCKSDKISVVTTHRCDYMKYLWDLAFILALTGYKA